MRAPPLHRGVVEAVVKAAMVVMVKEKTMTPALTIKSTGRISNDTSATRKGTHQHIALRSRMMKMMDLWRAPPAVFRNSRRISSL
jgi:hypothetical protein